jgi:hypothetical protein
MDTNREEKMNKSYPFNYTDISYDMDTIKIELEYLDDASLIDEISIIGYRNISDKEYAIVEKYNTTQTKLTPSERKSLENLYILKHAEGFDE